MAFILEAADDIAYKTADIEDAVKKGCISYERLLAELKAYKAGSQTNHYVQIVSWLEEKYGKAVGKGDMTGRTSMRCRTGLSASRAR